MKKEKIGEWFWQRVTRKKIAAVMGKLYPEDRTDRHLKAFYRKKMKRCLKGFAALAAVSALLIVSEWVRLNTDQTKLIRASPGGGDKVYHLRVSDGAYLKDQAIEIRLPARKMNEDEREEAFARCKAWLDQVWLGDNRSANQVCSDLYFPTEAAEYGMKIGWQPEDTRWISVDGSLTEAAYENAPISTRVTLTLQCQGETRNYTEDVTVRKPVLLPAQAGMKEIEDAVSARLETTAEEETVLLPASVAGRELTWKTIPEHTGEKFLIFGCLCLTALFFYKDEQVIKVYERRSQELQRAYPEIVYRLVLLIGAGLTIRRAWERIVEKEQEEKGRYGGYGEGYKEMEKTLQEMNRGITERQAYVNFGKRCALPAYMRLSALLVQQLQKGTKGAAGLLLNEAEEAEVMRRENARKLGEEAGVRMMFPMILLMGIIFAILIYPAVVSFRIG